jgi:hypothetical protein
VDIRSETETNPAMELHCGEVYADGITYKRHFILWLNGKRWEGTLEDTTHLEIERIRNPSGH